MFIIRVTEVAGSGGDKVPLVVLRDDVSRVEIRFDPVTMVDAMELAQKLALAIEAMTNDEVAVR
jgi:hypothetical protein